MKKFTKTYLLLLGLLAVICLQSCSESLEDTNPFLAPSVELIDDQKSDTGGEEEDEGEDPNLPPPPPDGN